MDLSKQPARPVPKPSFNIKNKAAGRRKKKQKKVETYKGVTIPKKRVRGQISKRDYELAMEHYGCCCAETGRTDNLEMHHVTFRSAGGSGKWRNLVPLTREFHQKCHRERAYADKWRELHKSKFGELYWVDKWYLWKRNLIPNCTDEAFEKYMEAMTDETLRQRADHRE